MTFGTAVSAFVVRLFAGVILALVQTIAGQICAGWKVIASGLSNLLEGTHPGLFVRAGATDAAALRRDTVLTS